MVAIRDLIGVELDEAQERLARAGVQVSTVTETRPPRDPALEGPFRVVRVRGEERGPVDLMVSRERYVPPLARQ